MYEYALTPSLSISFQRYPYPTEGFVTALPTSWGALPFLLSTPRQLILPSPDGEAFWIGLVPSPAGSQHLLRVLVSMADGGRIDALTGTPADDNQPSTSVENLLTPPRHGIPGIFRSDGSWWAFARDTSDTPAPACRGIELLCRVVTTAGPVPRTNHSGRQHAGPGYPPPPPESLPSQASPHNIDADHALSAQGNTWSVQVDLVQPGNFRAFGGTEVPTLEETNRYDGWRLP
jgi:hypothetical protein